MNTPAHLIIGLAGFARRDHPSVTRAAFIGALLPDLSLYVLASVSIYVLGIPAERVFGELYFSDHWQFIFGIDNSLVLWSLALGLALWRKSSWGIALTGAALLHLALDFPLHHDDGRAHFWPVSDWVFQSPLSYWDKAHYGGIIGPIEMLVSMLLCALLWRRFEGPRMRALIVVLGLAEIAPALFWLTVFTN